MRQASLKLNAVTAFALLLMIVMAVGLFYPGKLVKGSYVLDAWWNLGHIGFFAILSHFLLTLRHAKPALHLSFMSVLVGCAFFGIAIEAIQLFIDRNASVSDVLRNILGIGLGAFYYWNRCKTLQVTSTSFHAKKGIVLSALVSSALLGMGLIWALWLPVVESLNWLSAIKSPQVIFLTNEPWRHVRLSGQNGGVVLWQGNTATVHINEQRYSGLTLNRFNPDWTNFGSLNFDIYSHHNDTFDITCRIHDSRHNNDYSDRFHVSLSLEPGKNHYRIALDDIASAPINRPMTMTQIREIICFSVDGPSTSFDLNAIYLD